MAESASRASMLNLAFAMVTFGAGTIINIAIARLLGPTAKGTLSVFQTTQNVLLVAGCALQIAIVRNVAASRPGWPVLRKVLAAFAFAFAVVLTGILAVAIRNAYYRHVLFAGLTDFYLVVMFLAIWGSLWFSFRSSVASGVQQHELVSKTTFLATILNNVGSVIALITLQFTHQLNASSVIISSTACSVGLSTAIWMIATRRINVESSHPVKAVRLAKTIIKDSVPIYAHNMLEWANYHLDIFFVNALVGPREVGLYTVAIGISTQVLQIPAAIAGPLFARVAASASDDATISMIQYVYRVTFWLSALIAGAVYLVAPPVLPLLYGNRYSESLPLLMLLLPGTIVAGPTRLAKAYLYGRGNMRIPIQAEMIGLILTVVLNATLVRRFGVTGSAIASTCSYITLSLVVGVQFAWLSKSSLADLIFPRKSDWQRLLNTLRTCLPGNLRG